MLLAFAITLMTLIENTADTTVNTVKQPYIKVQFAGNTGLLSFGGGYNYRNKLSLDLSYGHLPKFINGVRTHTISFKPAYHFMEFAISGLTSDIYIGAAVNYSIGRNIYGKAPNYYPIDYVYPNAFNLNPCAGLRTSLKLKNGNKTKFSFYAELGTVDIKLWYAFKNHEISMLEIWNLGLGFMVYLN